jgi:hypothetical protein
MVTPSWLIDHAPGRAVLNGVRQRTPETRACGAEERSVGVPCSGLRQQCFQGRIGPCEGASRVFTVTSRPASLLTCEVEVSWLSKHLQKHPKKTPVNGSCELSLL